MVLLSTFCFFLTFLSIFASRTGAAIEELGLLRMKHQVAAMAEARLLNSVDEQGYTPFQRAVLAEDYHLIRELVAHGAMIDFVYQGRSIFEWATEPQIKIMDHALTLPGFHVKPKFDTQVYDAIRRTLDDRCAPRPWLNKILSRDDHASFQRFFNTTAEPNAHSYGALSAAPANQVVYSESRHFCTRLACSL